MGSLDTYTHVLVMPGLHIIHLFIFSPSLCIIIIIIIIIIIYSLFHDYSMMR